MCTTVQIGYCSPGTRCRRVRYVTGDTGDTRTECEEDLRCATTARPAPKPPPATTMRRVSSPATPSRGGTSCATESCSSTTAVSCCPTARPSRHGGSPRRRAQPPDLLDQSSYASSGGQLQTRLRSPYA